MTVTRKELNELIDRVTAIVDIIESNTNTLEHQAVTLRRLKARIARMEGEDGT